MWRDGIQVNNLVESLITPLDQRAGSIVAGRYGLIDPEERTLAEIGGSYGLSRERVRQIQSNALASMREVARDKQDAVRFVECAHEYLKDVGGVRQSNLLVRDLGIAWGLPDPDDRLFYNKLHFLVDVVGEPEVVEGSDEWHQLWYNDPHAYKVTQRIIRHLKDIKTHDFDVFLETAMRKFSLTELQILNYVSVSKDFSIGPYGDLGAKQWMHICPRTVRDKSYVALKRVGTPLHFRDIALEVNKITQGKHAHPATVHNELIKDPRFILVGRGMYALKNHHPRQR